VILLTPEILDRINEVVVQAGQSLVKKKEDEKLRGRCDSFVVETNVHYPTDINLLYDAMRKAITLVATLCTMSSLVGWRQSSHNLKKIKQLFRKAQQLKRSTSKVPEKKQKREQLIIEAHQAYIDNANDFSKRIRNTIGTFDSSDFEVRAIIAEIKMYLGHADRQRDQIYRRVVKGETIPHDEKVFSIFQEHTEWISKGKAGVPVELGLKVCVVEDQYGFILNHRVIFLSVVLTKVFIVLPTRRNWENSLIFWCFRSRASCLKQIKTGNIPKTLSRLGTNIRLLNQQ
jgi:IS5 family transposase